MTRIVSSYFDGIRKKLTAEGENAATFRHNGNRGSIREAFLREFLEGNTSQFCSVGSGEIIHRDMEDGDVRNQIDAILYNNRYPKLVGAGGVDLFMVETVSSFIEVKSTLTKDDIRQAARATKRIKSYPQADRHNFNPTGMVETPRPYSFLFAYDTGAASIERIAEWMKDVAAEDNYNLDGLRLAPPAQRPFFPHHFLDGVFVLNKGYVCVDALPFESPLVDQPGELVDYIWMRSPEAELELLWATLNEASEKLLWNRTFLGSYLPDRNVMVSD